MNKKHIAQQLAARLEAAAPTNMPRSSRGLPGGAIDWDKFADAIVAALEDMLHADTEEQEEAEVHLTRVDESGKGRADT